LTRHHIDKTNESAQFVKMDPHAQVRVKQVVGHRFLGTTVWHPEKPECLGTSKVFPEHKELANACLSPCKVSNCLVRTSLLLAPMAAKMDL